MKKICCLVLVIALSAILVACTASDRLLNYIDNGKYEEAAEMFNNMDAPDETLINSMIKRISEISDDFTNEEISYKDATEILSCFCEFENEEIKEKANSEKSYVSSLNKSKKSFSKGLTYEEMSNYLLAIESFSKVKKIDRNFDAAQKHLNKCKKKYKKTILSQADEYYCDGLYVDALEVINEGIEFFSEDTDLNKIVDECIKMILQEADEMVSNMQYGSAETLLKDALSSLPGNQSLSNKLSEVRNASAVTTEWMNRDFVIPDDDGYKIEYKIKLSPFTLIDNTNILNAYWEEIEDTESLPTKSDIEDSGIFKSYRDQPNNYYLAVGQVTAINKTKGWDLSEDNSRTASLLYSLCHNYRQTYDLHSLLYYTDDLTYEEDFLLGGKMVSNQYGPLSFVLILPEEINPNNPNGKYYDNYINSTIKLYRSDYDNPKKSDFPMKIIDA